MATSSLIETVDSWTAQAVKLSKGLRLIRSF